MPSCKIEKPMLYYRHREGDIRCTNEYRLNKKSVEPVDKGLTRSKKNLQANSFLTYENVGKTETV